MHVREVLMLSKVREDAKTALKTFGYKLNKGLLTIVDEDEACTKPKWAYYFARNIPGADIEKCQEAACKDPHYAYPFAGNIPGANIEKCQEAAYKDYYWVYKFAQDIPKGRM